jgi:hypothetical protein
MAGGSEAVGDEGELEGTSSGEKSCEANSSIVGGFRSVRLFRAKGPVSVRHDSIPSHDTSPRG